MGEIKAFLQEREEEGLLRTLKPISSRRQGRISFGGPELSDFSSNDYLGLSSHPKLIEAAQEALATYGAGSSASRLLSGSLDIHHRLESAVAAFKNKESALVFNSGYQANLGILSALYSSGDVIFSDKLNHASITDGIVLSGAKLVRFAHNDPGHLELLLKKERSKFKRALIITETIFSMDGDRAPLHDLVGLKERYNCSMMVDEAHATGIYGAHGSGVVEEEGLSHKIDLIMGTFSKGLGSFGAYCASSKEITDYLINMCRSFIYSTSLPPATIAANLASLAIVKEEPHRRQRLLELAHYFRLRLISMGFDVRGSSHIIPVITGENVRTQELARALQARGYWVLPIRPPTVPVGQARLRFSLTYHHNKDIVDELLRDIADVKI